MIFPEFKGKKFGYINLNDEGKAWLVENADRFAGAPSNPLMDPVVCQEMVASVHTKLNIDFSYGGWLEDRSAVWKDSYLEEENAPIHLGVDINALPGTKIAADPGTVVRIDDDYPEEGGWGPRVIVHHASQPIYMIYAHLDRKIGVKVGDRLVPGQVFAEIGTAPWNGNWYPHVHVQTLSIEAYDEAAADGFKELDGYGMVADIPEHARRHPDPLQYIVLAE